eukprot:3209258-Prymnesium_polylepis.1
MCVHLRARRVVALLIHRPPLRTHDVLQVLGLQVRVGGEDEGCGSGSGQGSGQGRDPGSGIRDPGSGIR